VTSGDGMQSTASTTWPRALKQLKQMHKPAPPPSTAHRSRCPLSLCTQMQRTLLAQLHPRTARRELQGALHAPQRPHPRLAPQPHRCATAATAIGRQLQPRALLDRRQQLRASSAAATTGLCEGRLREAPRHAGEPAQPPRAETAADDGEGLVRKLVAAVGVGAASGGCSSAAWLCAGPAPVAAAGGTPSSWLGATGCCIFVLGRACE
jgi:hypothetical protein